jgi:chromosome segregation ATPase
MDESWNHLQNLEAHIKEHNTHIEKLTPLRTRHHSRQSSIVDEIPKKPLEFSSQEKLLAMAKELKEKERELSYLKRDIAGLEIYKDQCINMQGQIKLLREKAVLCEREAQAKSFLLSTLETSTVPKAEKLEIELKETSSKYENLQKSYTQVKKELEEKTFLVNSLKQNYSGQDNLIKTLEEEKRALKFKLSELQLKFEEVCIQNDKNLDHLKNKDQLTLALEEDNERLRAQIENTMESLQKCQYELSLLPKLRQDIHQREQLISAASREIEKEKAAKLKAIEEKSSMEKQFEIITECTEGNNPLDYIQELKSLLNKSAKDHSSINDELVHLKEKQRYIDIESTQALQFINNFLEIVTKTLVEDLSSDDIITFPAIDNMSYPILTLLCQQIQISQKNWLERLVEIEESNNYLNEKISKYEKNVSIRQKVQEMEERILGQEKLSEQLTKENFRIKKELETCKQELNQSEIEKNALNDETEQLKLRINNVEEYIKDSVHKMNYTDWQSNWNIEDGTNFLVSQLSVTIEKNKELIKMLEDYKVVVGNMVLK